MKKVYFSIIILFLAFVNAFAQTPCLTLIRVPVGIQTICARTSISDIEYQVGGSATGAIVSPLPAGLTSIFTGGVLTISGTPDISAGTYVFSVTPTGGTCSTPEVFTINIIEPIAEFTSDYSLGPAPRVVNFTNTSRNANLYNWDFGDGHTSNATDTSYTYTSSGIFDVVLTASDSSFCFTTMSIRIYNDITNYFAYYTTTYDILQNNFILNVDPYSSNKAKKYKWDFGDGTTSALASPTHTFTKDSVYNVCMKIYTATGKSSEYCHEIGKDQFGNIYRTAGFTLNVTHFTDILELEKRIEIFSIAPNPTTGMAQILFKQVVNNAIIKILNLTGQQVFQQNNFTGNLLTIDITDQAAGVYILEVLQNEVVSRAKLVKQ
jgi:PKD domain/Secretion system C-terminal sorting domain